MGIPRGNPIQLNLKEHLLRNADFQQLPFEIHRNSTLARENPLKLPMGSQILVEPWWNLGGT